MGHLTNDMTRLRGEVEALRDARGVLMSDLTRGAGDLAKAVADLRQETADDLMGARLAWRGVSPGKSRPVPPKKAVAAPEAPAVETPRVKVPPPVSASMPFQKRKEKSNWVNGPPKL
jgi:hypothetical protein